MMPLSRRDLLRAAPLAAAAGVPLRIAAAAEPPIVRMQEPRNLETPISELLSGGGLTTKTEAFFVRSHFAVPAVDPKTFKLTIEGHVENRLELTLDDLKKMEATTRAILLECAGNGRVFLVPQARGLQWGHGGAGLASWTGVPLAAVLDRARVKAGAVDAVFIGADSGSIAEPATPGAIHFDRGIPIAKARKDETLLAWNMNGDPLTPSHGAPLRAVVGGWYGMASVKWLSRIVVTDRPHAGFWQTFDYSIWDRAGASPQLVPVAAIQPKAIITSVGTGDILKLNEKRTIAGVAWAGENGGKVEVSLDSGKSWQAAWGAAEPFQWGKWQFEWTPAVRGPLKLLARCTDDKGRTQPEKRDPDRRTYMINHLVPVEVSIR